MKIISFKNILCNNYVVVNKMENQKQYVEGLEDFCEASEENGIDVNGIMKQFPEFSPKVWAKILYGRNVRILDIGSGNGEKALRLCERINDLEKARPKVDLIEPNSEQRERLESNLGLWVRRGVSHYQGNVFPCILQDFNPKNNGRYDIIMFLHSLYQFPRDEKGNIVGIEKVKYLMTDDGCGIVVLEDDEGYFRRMKRELFPLFGKTNLLSIKDVERSFCDKGFSTKLGNKIDMKLYLDKFEGLSDLELGRTFGFLFSTAFNEHDLNEEQYTEVGRWMRGNYISEGIAGANWKTWKYLDISDRVLWVYNKGRENEN